MNQVEQKKSVPPKKQKPKLRGGKIPPSQEIKARAFNQNPTARTQKVTKGTIDDFLSKIAKTEYIALSSDSFSKIALHAHGDADKYHSIFNANTGIPNDLPEQSMSGVLQELKDREEYKIYKKLKTEVGEFYPYPGLWLEAPHELLSGHTPLEMALTSPQGAEIVYDLIASIKAGHFS